MADTTSLYVSKGYAELDGRVLFTSNSLELKQATNSDDVDTILDEACGFAQGTVKYVLEIGSPVPGPGFEVDFFALCEAGSVHQLRFILLRPEGGQAYNLLLRGVFRDPTAGLKANAAATASVSYHGRNVSPATGRRS